MVSPSLLCSSSNTKSLKWLEGSGGLKFHGSESVLIWDSEPLESIVPGVAGMEIIYFPAGSLNMMINILFLSLGSWILTLYVFGITAPQHTLLTSSKFYDWKMRPYSLWLSPPSRCLSGAAWVQTSGFHDHISLLELLFCERNPLDRSDTLWDFLLMQQNLKTFRQWCEPRPHELWGVILKIYVNNLDELLPLPG